MKREVNEYLFLTLIIFVFLFLFLVDYLTPVGVNIGMMYFMPIVFTGFLLDEKKWTYLIVFLSTLAVVISGFFFHFQEHTLGTTIANTILLALSFAFVGTISIRLKKSIFAQSEYDKLVRAGLAIAPIGICYINNEGKILYANDQFLRMTELDPISVENASISDFLWNAKSQKIDHLVAAKKHTQQAIVRKKIFLGKSPKTFTEVDFTCKTVSSGKSDVQIFLFKETGEREKLLAKLKSNNTKLKFVVEEANEGSWEYNFLNKSIKVSDKFWGFIGKNPKLDPHFDEAIKTEDHDRFMHKLDSYAQSFSTDLFLEEITCTDIQGNEKVFLLKGKCIKTKKDLSPEIMMGIFIDITEQKILEKNLEDSNRNLEQFAYIASHDLKAPIRHIHNYAELLSEELEEEAQNDDIKTYIHTILRNTKRMKKMVEALLNYARLGYNDLEKTKVDLNQVVDYICELMKEETAKTSAIFKYENLPKIEANKDLVTNLMQNLIGNSLKFRQKDKSPVISIEHKVTENFYEISVEDNGIGIEDDNAQEIFSLFKRTKGAEKYEGTGIGLSIAKRIMDLHNGSIHHENLSSGGTRFVLKFPK